MVFSDMANLNKRITGISDYWYLTRENSIVYRDPVVAIIGTIYALKSPEEYGKNLVRPFIEKSRLFDVLAGQKRAPEQVIGLIESHFSEMPAVGYYILAAAIKIAAKNEKGWNTSDAVHDLEGLLASQRKFETENSVGGLRSPIDGDSLPQEAVSGSMEINLN
jgi:hypothetical protein